MSTNFKLKSKKSNKRTISTINIIKSPSDHRAYRLVILPNGITALLISESDGPDSEHDDYDYDDESMEVDDSNNDEGQAGAALCIGAGIFADPDEIPGLAHFTEHMVFKGSKKYPKVNYWDDFLAKNAGESNAWTDCERTCFFFTCDEESIFKALDIFAQFFICPLFDKESVDGEIVIVDNEYQMETIKDYERMRSIISHELVEKDHPMSRFMTGNIKSLKEDPEKNGSNVYKQLQCFYQRMYSAHYMTLVVHAPETLNALEEKVFKIFSKITNNGLPRPRFLKAPFQESKMNRLLKVVPVCDIQDMSITWALPPLMEHYKTGVLDFLSLVISNEGKGSILSFLRKKHWAIYLTAGNDFTGYTYNTTWSAFTIDITLTEKGIAQYAEVLKTVYQYINLLKKGLPVHVFQDLKHIQDIGFYYQEKESVFSYVEQLAENMHMFPPEHYLCGKLLYFEYNEQIIKACLDFLWPQRMMVILFDKQFSKIPFLSEEPWLGGKYTVEEFDCQLIQRLLNVEPNPELWLPEPNPYIAKDFTLVKTRRITKFPVVVMDVAGCRMWYRKSKFSNPDAFVFLHMFSPVVSRTLDNIVLGDIFLSALQHQLTERLYCANLAGYEYAITGTEEGIVIRMDGYSEKIQLVIQNMIKVFEECEITREVFNSVIADLRQTYYNQLGDPNELAKSIRFAVTDESDTSTIARYEQLNKITYDMLTPYLQNFFSHLFIEGLVTGNLRPQDAVFIGNMMKVLIMKPLAEEDFPKPTVLELPVGNHICFLAGINKEDINSCVAHYFQQGLGNIYNSCLNSLLEDVMSEPLFNNLRTENQTCYDVYCQAVVSCGVLGYVMVVRGQANRCSTHEIDELLVKFQKSFLKTLQDIPSRKFKELVELHAFTSGGSVLNLFDESHRFWQEIVDQSYVFDRAQLEYDTVNKISQKSLIDWYKNLISDNARKLTVMVEGNKQQTPRSVPQPAKAGSGLRSLVKGWKKFVPNLSRSRPRDLKLRGPLIQLQDLGENFITDICEFKRSLQPYPCHAIKK